VSWNGAAEDRLDREPRSREIGVAESRERLPVRVLSDSNVGWAGGLKALDAELTKRHIADCRLAYSSPPNPANFGIPCQRPPTYFSMILDTGQQRAVPEQIQGPIFVSTEETAGSF
jgi:hypothetical protein